MVVRLRPFRKDIYSFIGDGESVFPEEVLALVEPHRRDLLLMIARAPAAVAWRRPAS